MDSSKTNESPVRQRVRIRFRKQGDLRLIGHRDLVRTMERLFRRAGLRLSMSEGFHPKPRMSFPSALAVGMEGLDELMELELAQDCRAEEVLARLETHTVPGLSFHHAEVLPPGNLRRKARVRSLAYQIPVPETRRRDASDRISRLLAQPSIPLARPGRDEPVELCDTLEGLSLTDQGRLSMTFRVTGQASAGPRDVLAALRLADLESEGGVLQRTAVEVTP
ncbi:MAG: DUF2344 domain-containing protein [Pirellulales bacterium]|nr:DUF2344 domain-containing protein [Pirellulales bacterium]